MKYFLRPLLAVALVLTGLSIPAGIANAAGTPDIAVARAVSASTLYGNDVPVTLTATNASATNGYNLAFTDVLPAGATLVGSSYPVSQSIPLAGGGTKLIWNNVADLSAGAEVVLSYSFSYPTGGYDVGSTLTGTAEAFVNSDPRVIVKFDSSTGVSTASSYTGSDTDQSTTTLSPFILSKTEPSAEQELLRGVHDNKTVYTLTVTNNTVAPTTGFSITDYLPAGLEFLGCEGAGNTSIDNSAAEEFPGSGRIDDSPLPAGADCGGFAFVATTVTVDPDGSGPLEPGVYTRVDWSALGTLAAGESLTIRYAAAIPLRENVQFDGVATANLDNNTGALTEDEQELINYAVASGTYKGTSYSNSSTAQVFAEDLSIRKAVDDSNIVQGGTNVWTLSFSTSEYSGQTSDLTVVDTIPDGLDYQGGSLAEDSVVDNADGTQTVTWTIAGFAAASGANSFTVTTKVRETYRNGGGPVSANDSWTNSVSLAATATVITDNDGSTTSLPVTDASSASQSAEGVTIDKEVAQPAAVATSCGAGAGYTFSQTVTGPFHPGDRVCYRLTVSFPGALDTLDSIVNDFLPAGLVVEGTPEYTTASTLDAGDGITFAHTPGTPLLTWNLGDVDAAQVFQVVVTTRITDPSAVTNGDITSNIMKMTHKNSGGTVFQFRDQADTLLEKPVVALAKGITALNTVAVPGAPVKTLAIQALDRVTYTVVVTNTGGQDATNISVRDNLPALLECTDVSNISASGTCDSPNRRLSWTVPLVPAGGSVTLTYDVVTPADSSAGDIFPNAAGVRNYEGATNTGTPQVYVPSNNIDPTLNSSANSSPANDAAIVSIASPTVTKTMTTSINETGNDLATQATIGETVTFTVTTTVPQGSTLYPPTAITDTLDANYTIIGTPRFTVNGGPATDATVNGQLVTATLPGTYVNLPSSGNDSIVLTITAIVKDASGPVRSAGLDNSAQLAYTSIDNVTRTVTSNTVTARIVEPLISVVKSSNATSGAVVAGQIVTYTLAVRNSAAANVSIAYDTLVVDQVPETIEPINAAGDPVTTDQTLPGGGVWNNSARTITFSVSSIAPGAGPDLSYDARVVTPLISGTQIINTVDATTTSLAGFNPNERTSTSAAGGSGSGYQSTSSVTLSTPALSLTKTASPATATVGEVVDYTVDVTIPASVVAFDATVIDTLPANVRFGELLGSSCDQGGTPCAVSATLIGAPTTTDRTIGYFLGDLSPASSSSRVVTISYTGIVTTGAVSGDTLQNTARPYWNSGDTITGTPTSVPAASSYANLGSPGSASVSVVEPRLTIDKKVAGQIGDSDSRRAKPGEVLTYTVSVTNTGTSPAYDVTVTDTPDPRVTGFTSVAPVGVTPTDTDPSDSTLGWTILGPIAPNETVDISYTVTMPLGDDSLEVVLSSEINNTADVPHYFGVAPADQVGGIDYRDYDNVTADIVNVELDVASLGDRVWFDVNDDGVQDATEPALAGVGLTIVYFGADGVFGTTDDETVTRTTDSTGNYLVNNLPGGTYRVTVDASTLPAGMQPSFDLDGTTVVPNGVWQGTLAEDGRIRNVDFGYTGTGSIGDTVWFDQDGDHVKDADEPGLGGATVTVISGGLDGDLTTTADNITYTTTTNTAGAYSVGLLPAGPYSVTVSGVPTGYNVVTDPNGGSSATSVTTLGAGQALIDQDFGIAGTGSIGDFVWLDRDGDGTQDAGEPGVIGATVQLTWFGVDGVSGGGDDGVFTTTTDANGAYSFPNLLPGSFSVQVTGGLPAGATNSFDRDGNNNSTAPVTLAAGQNVADVDFGYDVTSVIGDRVWWDRNADGVQDTNEPGLGGVNIRVTYFGSDGLPGGGDDIVFPTATTNANGDWTVIDVPDGEFLVEVIGGVPAGFSATFDADSGLSAPDQRSIVTLSGSDLDQDFGFAGNSSISDTVWLDLDQNGNQNGNEPGLPGVTVTTVWLGPDGVAGGGDDVTFVEVTDADGRYLFPGLPEGAYSVTVDLDTVPSGLVATFDADANANVPTPRSSASGVDANSTVTLLLDADTAAVNIDFGYVGTGRIGDTVWLDQNGDGVADATEPGLAEVGVSLTWAGLDGVFGTPDDVVSTTTTDSAGAYLFENLPAGRFTVALSNLPAGVGSTFDPDAGADDTSELTLIGGEQNLDQDFGYRGDAGVGDLLWLDVDNDGVQGPNEPGLSGVDVTVRSAGADGVFDTADDLIVVTTTDAAGNYLAAGLPAGDVRVSYDPATLPEGYVPAADLDAGVLSESTATLVAGETRLDVDFIVIGSATLNGVVFDDKNGNGVRDPEDSGIPNATVTVIWNGPKGPVPIIVTTGPDGTWQLLDLPGGEYSATVDLDSVDSGFRPSTGTTSTVDLPPTGTRSVIQGLTKVSLAYTGGSIALGASLGGLLLVLGMVLMFRSRRSRKARPLALSSGE
ncbi:fimbrial isopeptide formation D2 family protein/uncharacterized repeat protein (TIGR01451 family) [Salinibacterium sp. CAN_S4]|uniref:SdrD B-like domain-containing protein n=1 Tax=Salinibacterium sp. CAN_S4 TaxID=2787727 RepID=UPI0018EF7C9C